MKDLIFQLAPLINRGDRLRGRRLSALNALCAEGAILRATARVQFAKGAMRQF